MATHPGMLIAYDAAGEIIATTDYLVQYDENGDPLGLVNFAEMEEAGMEMTEAWTVEPDPNTTVVKGSKVWPEWLGGEASEFRVELDGPPGNKRISALVHKTSGHRRERAAIEAAIQARIDEAGDGPADLRDIVGGPNKPLRIDEHGRNAPKVPHAPSKLPLLQPRRVTEPKRPKTPPGRKDLPIPL